MQTRRTSNTASGWSARTDVPYNHIEWTVLAIVGVLILLLFPDWPEVIRDIRMWRGTDKRDD